MIRTRVGYTGGTTPKPTYRNLGDHTETVQLDFDPRVINYAQLLDVFWRAHPPTVNAVDPQYKNVIFCHGQAQCEAAQASRDELQKSFTEPIQTEIREAGTFYRAEDYHQKYRVRAMPAIRRAFKRYYPGLGDPFTDSTAATRVNGILGHHGTRSMESEIGLYGLLPDQQEQLRRLLD